VLDAFFPGNRKHGQDSRRLIQRITLRIGNYRNALMRRISAQRDKRGARRSLRPRHDRRRLIVPPVRPVRLQRAAGEADGDADPVRDPTRLQPEQPRRDCSARHRATDRRRVLTTKREVPAEESYPAPPMRTQGSRPSAYASKS
jgi:hypothetical protein